MIYKFRENYSLPVSAQTVGERIAYIRQNYGTNGIISANDVIEDSTPNDAPLHPCFTWDQEAAAHKCRLDEARRILTSVAEIHVDLHGNTQEIIMNVSVCENPRSGSAYMLARDALASQKYSEKILRDAIIGLHGWRRRYAHLEMIARDERFKRVVDAIGDLPENP